VGYSVEIVGTAFHSAAEVVPRFLSSLERVEFEGFVRLFIGEQDPTPNIGSSRFEVSYHRISPERFHIQCERYFSYQEILKGSKLNSSHIFLCDVSDLYFQKNPFFKIDWAADLDFFLEDRNIEDCPYNSAWIEFAYGKTDLERLRAKTISCSGSTFGRTEAIAFYLERMCEELRSHAASSPHLPIGLDQGIHNFLLRSGFFANFELGLHSNSEALVGTLGYSSKQINEEGFFVCPEGRVFSVVHQWNRANVSLLTRIVKLRGVDFGDVITSRQRIHGQSGLRIFYCLAQKSIPLWEGSLRTLPAVLQRLFSQELKAAFAGDVFRKDCIADELFGDSEKLLRNTPAPEALSRQAVLRIPGERGVPFLASYDPDSNSLRALCDKKVRIELRAID
jgi:hypothetical protein